ncbi:hypothetical protein niasHS_014336 [Heterodera schachtii]|uniref:Uncharacterized protein n=1 Tax=Heterodera schachtii TaxID=97005 RepID=A0ABD2IBR1_HETSC
MCNEARLTGSGRRRSDRSLGLSAAEVGAVKGVERGGLVAAGQGRDGSLGRVLAACRRGRDTPWAECGRGRRRQRPREVDWLRQAKGARLTGSGRRRSDRSLGLSAAEVGAVKGVERGGLVAAGQGRDGSLGRVLAACRRGRDAPWAECGRGRRRQRPREVDWLRQAKGDVEKSIDCLLDLVMQRIQFLKDNIQMSVDGDILPTEYMGAGSRITLDEEATNRATGASYAQIAEQRID